MCTFCVREYMCLCDQLLVMMVLLCVRIFLQKFLSIWTQNVFSIHLSPISDCNWWIKLNLLLHPENAIVWFFFSSFHSTSNTNGTHSFENAKCRRYIQLLATAFIYIQIWLCNILYRMKCRYTICIHIVRLLIRTFWKWKLSHFRSMCVCVE